MSGPLVHDGLLPSPLGRGIPLNCGDVWGSRVDGKGATGIWGRLSRLWVTWLSKKTIFGDPNEVAVG
jgi:hypothetical protein